MLAVRIDRQPVLGKVNVRSERRLETWRRLDEA